MTSQYVERPRVIHYNHLAGLQVHPLMQRFVEDELLSGLSLTAPSFWQGLRTLVDEFAARNRTLLDERERLQQEVDAWHLSHRGRHHDQEQYVEFLRRVGYLQPEGEDFVIGTSNVDDEIARQAGPQLVVPVMNARFALNAANARWGSLYDALYGTDAIPEENGQEKGGDYNPLRGRQVIAFARRFLDAHFPLIEGSHDQATAYRLSQGELVVELADGSRSGLQRPTLLRGFRGVDDQPEAILLCHNGLHVEIQIDRRHPVGATDAAGICDILLEAAVTTIMDCEDSIAAVDAEDKVLAYRPWLGLMKGTLEEEVSKDGETFTRRMNPDRQYFSPVGGSFALPGRSLLFVRNVGLLMTTPAVLDEAGREIPEGILDGLVTATAALYDLQGLGRHRNSRTGSVYIVKPKMHGPDEVAFSNDLFDRIEDILGLARHTLKMGIMDEERRTSANLKECIRAARDRVVFINTGFLDRTGDEIHTAMEAGPFAPKGELKGLPWQAAYERRNVAIGLACGFRQRAQIGKGMWAVPDQMAAMLDSKMAHPLAGANTAWVPSPTAAVLHALHYHEVDVAAVQADPATRDSAPLETMLTLPLLGDRHLEAEEIQRELENNAQGILGYVVRWVEQGIGCSKVPDINDVGLMEDRATLRISSQHICNWLHHGICTEAQVMATLEKMAAVVDRQNADDPHYRPMGPDCHSSFAFCAARDLILKGREQPSGYTEPLLHQYRARAKWVQG